MADSSPPRLNDLSRSYGSSWSQTNASTLFEWVNIAAFNIRCLELNILRYRRFLRYQMILNLLLSTGSGTLSVSQFGFSGSETADFWIKIVFTVFSFGIAISAGALKVYEIQDRLEAAIRLKQEWMVFSTAIASELQLPIALRHDALYTIDKNKGKYLDLLKIELDVTDAIKKQVAKELPHPAGIDLNMLSLSRIMVDICISELNDYKSDNTKDRDRLSKTVGATAHPRHAAATASAETAPASINEAVPAHITLNFDAPPTTRLPVLPASPEPVGLPPAPQPSYSAPLPLQSPRPQG